jgi:hypothetical protein
MALTPLRIFRLIFGGLFTGLGIWASARLVLELEAIRALWPDWLILIFPALILAAGLLVLLAAFRNSPQRPFLRQRTGAARIFGSVAAGFVVISFTLQRLAQQTTLRGVIIELVVAAVAVGILATLFGAINEDERDRENAGRK